MNDQSQRYTIEAELGRGASATVYRARDTVLGRVVALKVMDAALTADPSYMARFIREAQLAARLDHPNIVAVHDAGALPGGEPFIAMRFVEGVTLAELIATQGPLAPALVADIVRQVAAALDEMHANDLVHRDLKPANVMIDAVGRVLVADLGIAVAADLDSVTQTGMVIGTPMYMAPEQVRGERATPAVDIYALGVIAFELLTGSPPFRGSGTSLMYHIVHSPPPSLAETGVAVPAALEQVIGRAMAKAPADRWSTAGELAAAMTGSGDTTHAAPIASPALATLAQRTTPTKAPAWPEPTPTTARSRRFDTVIRERPKRTLAWASAVVALGAIFGAGSQCVSGGERASVSPPGVAAGDDETATATVTETETEATAEPEATGAAIQAASTTPTATVAASSTATPASTHTPAPPATQPSVPTATIAPAPTSTPQPTATPPPHPTATPTPPPTATPTATATPHPTPSPTPALPPTAPSNVHSESGGAGVMVRWSDNSDNENGFIISFMAENLNDADNPYFEQHGQAGPNATSAEVSAPILPGVYAGGRWGVAAYNDAGASAITWE